ncbi:ABC transporter substrate binding protein [Peristeroidobacter soli]|uniref:ABC transporter substrate binding protein n=1 Tax=Peristeroidobacter soli TaxID=2497877 RepID=UPI00101BDD09|nr:ABC transporter substrate binding protein [Peristeroidobacter soli]
MIGRFCRADAHGLPRITGRPHLALLVCMSFLLCLTFALPAAARSDRPYHIAMVLPHSEGNIERAFEEYFAKRDTPLRTTLVTYSGRSSDQPALISKLRRLAPDLIYTSDTATTLAVAGPLNADRERYIADIPIVFTSVSDPIAAGLVTDLQRPARKLTGIIPVAPMSTQLDTIAAYRHFGKLGYLYGPSAQSLAVRDRLRDSGRRRGFNLVDRAVALDRNGAIDVAALAAQVRSLKQEGVDFLYLGPETFITSSLQKAVAQAALAVGLPTYSALESAVHDNGALFGVFSPDSNVGRFAALKAMRLLTRSVPAGNEPIESLEHFSIVINMQTAQRLQLYPPLLLLDAAQVLGGPP